MTQVAGGASCHEYIPSQVDRCIFRAASPSCHSTAAATLLFLECYLKQSQCRFIESQIMSILAGNYIFHLHRRHIFGQATLHWLVHIWKMARNLFLWKNVNLASRSQFCLKMQYTVKCDIGRVLCLFSFNNWYVKCSYFTRAYLHKSFTNYANIIIQVLLYPPCTHSYSSIKVMFSL